MGLFSFFGCSSKEATQKVVERNADKQSLTQHNSNHSDSENPLYKTGGGSSNRSNVSDYSTPAYGAQQSGGGVPEMSLDGKKEKFDWLDGFMDDWNDTVRHRDGLEVQAINDLMGVNARSAKAALKGLQKY